MSSSTSGVLLVDKPEGPTSHDVVARVRRKLGIRKVGHAGTLDPAASGLLILCVGDATRLLEYLTSQSKRYAGTMVFGIGTDTHDATGQVTVSKDASRLRDANVQTAREAMIGSIVQTVPEYSAVHIDGARAYELARAGQSVEMPQREIFVSRFDVGPLAYENDVAVASFDVICSKGTYIRALCRDLGAAVGIPAHMKTLCRTEVGRATLAEAVDLATFLESDTPHTYLRDPLPYFDEFVQLDVSIDVIERISQGQRVRLEQRELVEEANAGDVVMLLYAGGLAAVVDVVDDVGTLQPKKVFWKRG